MKKLFFLFVLPLLGWAASAQQADTVRVTAGAHQVTEDQLNKGLVTSGVGALNGQTAGVTISSGSNRAAMLSAVRVRGTTSLTGGNDPLVLIDGVIADLATLGSLYPGDIERFDILKDASETAQYGSRGASGVIAVTTKKGQGGGFSISYDGLGGFESVYRNLKMLSAEGFRTYNRGQGLPFLDHGFDADMPSSILRTGYVHHHHIAFAGGSEQSHYRASIGLMDHGTVVRTNAYRNYTVKLDLSQQAFDGLMDFDFGVFGSLQRADELHDMQHLFYSSAAFNPTFRPTAEPDGSYSQIPAASQINHPVSLLEKQFGTENAHVSSHLRMAVHLLPGLDLTAFGSYSYNASNDAHFFPTIIWSHGEAYRRSQTAGSILGQLALHYGTGWGRHRLDLDAMGEAQRTTQSGFFTTTTHLSSNAFGIHAIQAGSVRPWDGTGSFFADPRMLSFSGGAKYEFAQRYILSANVRADASSKFGANHRWGFFPSVSGSWVAVREPFFQQLDWLSNLKFNLGYGLSGNEGGLDSYLTRALYSPVGVTDTDGIPAVTYGLVHNANPELRWEVRSSINAGMESAFLDSRIVFTAEYYWSLTRDMLYNYQVSVPPFAFGSLMANLGRMSNSGWEFGLGGTLVSTSEVELNINLNLSLQRNRLLSLNGWYQGEYLQAPQTQPFTAMNGAGFHGGNNDVTYQIVGQPLGVFFLPHCTGLARAEDGSYYYQIADLDGNGKADDGTDRYVAGQAMPKALLGSNISLRWRDLDLSVQVNGAFGHKIFNGTSLTYMNLGSLPYYNVLAGAPARGIKDQTVTDYWLERGDYLNVDYATVGWNVPLHDRFVRSLRLSASVNNLATLTAYSGLTPMINHSVLDGTLGLDDKISFPVYRSYTIGLSIQF